MDNVIGYKGTIEDRTLNWQAMLIYKKGYKVLKENPATFNVASADLKRYKRMVKLYAA